jgi:hypothetical protein
MKSEIESFANEKWVPHHQGFKGNYSIPLISVNGGSNNLFKGPMKITQSLEQLPYIKQVISSFGEVCGRSRLMMLEGDSQVPLHCDINSYWFTRVRVHIPITTNENVLFQCGDKEVHMRAGECWLFDSWKNHRVVNNSLESRVHLVVDFSGSADFWNLVEKSEVPWLDKPNLEEKLLTFNEKNDAIIQTENYNVSLVMLPGELAYLVAELLHEVNSVKENSIDEIEALTLVLLDFQHNWRALWATYGMNEAGWQAYHQCRDKTYHEAVRVGGKLLLTNKGKAVTMLANCIIDPALNPEIR